ncbi:hypothetical protein [Sphingobacterium kitahiroshimense]|uniref:hypothetical protein n=1 Tax=Sphingobacterium kitahiroshimense TaxID=470446 RepID=UPI003209591D
MINDWEEVYNYFQTDKKDKNRPVKDLLIVSSQQYNTGAILLRLSIWQSLLPRCLILLICLQLMVHTSEPAKVMLLAEKLASQRERTFLLYPSLNCRLGAGDNRVDSTKFDQQPI